MFISEAYAQAASGAAAQPGGLESMFSSFGVMILIFAVFWFLLIRPQQKRQKEHKKMIDSLTTGNEVITAGGICGKIVAADENYINLQIAAVDDKPVVITFQRVAIQAVLPTGTVTFSFSCASLIGRRVRLVEPVFCVVPTFMCRRKPAQR